MNRSRTREIAMEILYQMEIQTEYTWEFAEKTMLHYGEKVDEKYIHRMIHLWLEHRDHVEKSIENHLKKWKIERISRLDIAILRLALVEMFYFEDIPKKVSVNEAVNLAKKYIDEKSGKFINGILSQFMGENQ